MNWIIQHLLFITFLVVLLALGLILFTAWALSKIYSHEGTRSQVASAFASVTIAVLFSVIVGHVYAVKRDRDNRLRALRDQHFAQLKPILRTESTRLQNVSTIIQERGHFTGITPYEPESPSLSTFLYPDFLSNDLPEHFSDYDRSKQMLIAEITAQDAEFRVALSDAISQVDPALKLDTNWKENVAVSVLEHCMDRGPGITLVPTSRGFDFESFGASAPNMPKPITEQLNALKGFDSFVPDESFRSHCDNLTRRAKEIISHAQELSRQAQYQSESTILKGDCGFLKSNDLTD
jgi:hypothetical protein